VLTTDDPFVAVADPPVAARVRLRPTEWIFAGLTITLAVLIVATGQTGVMISHYGETVKFSSVVVGTTALIWLRAYLWPAPADRGAPPAQRARSARRVAVTTIREFSPIFALLVIYEILHLLTPTLRPDVVDGALAAIDRALLGVDVGRWLNDTIGSHPLTALMIFCYASYAVASPAYAVIQYMRGNMTAFHDFALAIAITALIGYSGYLLVPAVGPYLFQPELYPDPLPGWGHGGLLDVIAEAKGSARDAFPSLHTAMTTVLLGMMWRHARRLFWTYLPIALGLYVATLYLRVHYAVDVAAGFVTAAIALALAPRINRWWERRATRPTQGSRRTR
jgi:membrane-associated phospholipid phosphatase